MLIEFVSKTADGRTAAPRGRTRCPDRTKERRSAKKKRNTEEGNIVASCSGQLARLHRALSFLTLSRFYPFRSFPPVALSPPLRATRSPARSTACDSHGGKACIIRRNSTGITLVRIPSSHPAAALLCRATNLFNRFSVVHEAAPLLARSP